MLPSFGAEGENIENAENDHRHCRLQWFVCKFLFAFSQNAFVENGLDVAAQFPL